MGAWLHSLGLGQYEQVFRDNAVDEHVLRDRGASERHGITAEMELRLLAEYCTDVIARVGADMTFSYISPSAARMFRRPVSEVIRHPVREFVFPEDLPIIAAATARLLAGEVDSSTVTVRALRGDCGAYHAYLRAGTHH
jgi:PAS domain-containing protein